MVHQAFEECLFVHLSVINELHCIIGFAPHNKNYRALIIKQAFRYYLNKTYY